MKTHVLLIALLLPCISSAQQLSSPEQKSGPSSQQQLRQTCNSLKAGTLKNAPAELVDTCKALEQEREKRQEEQSDKMKLWAGEYCHAAWAPDSTERARMHQVLLRLQPTIGRQYPKEQITYIAVKSGTINAWTVPGRPQSFVCMPTAIINFMSNDGELAFVMGHETGHAVDEACKGHARKTATQRNCESRADAAAFDLLVKSGFSPLDAGAAFGKLEMYSGDIRTDGKARIQALARNHPMTPERIQHMHEMLKQYNAVMNGPLAH